MDKFVIRGGNPLVGTIRVSGAKNSALPCMAAAILTEDEVILENIPQVRDIETERRLLASMGAEVELRLRPRAAPHHDQLPHPLRSRRQIRDRENHARQFPGARSRSSRAPAWRASPCPAAAPSAAGPSICTSRDWKRWAQPSPRSTAISKPAPIASQGRASRLRQDHRHRH